LCVLGGVVFFTQKPAQRQKNTFSLSAPPFSVGTPFYCAPELLRQRYGRAVDVWSAGVTAYVLLTGHWPWHCDPDIADAIAADAAATGGGDGLRSGRCV
jgi:serine/threonine protein kinase